MPNPYNTRSAAQNANVQPENTQGYSQQMANQNFDHQEPIMSQQGQSMGQTMAGETMGHTMGTQDSHLNDSNRPMYDSNQAMHNSNQAMHDSNQAMYEQDIGINNSNHSNQQSMGQTNHNQASGHEESLADRVEGMLEKLASKITGHENHHRDGQDHS